MMTVRQRENQGLVIIAVLWTVVILIVITAAVARTSRLDTKISVVRGQSVKCSWANRAGLETAIAELNEDLPDSDCLSELWSDNPDYNNVQLSGCVLSIRVTDEAGKLNVNTASAEQLLDLPRMTEEAADAIIDWRDGDDEMRPSGAEAGYYENLQYPYRIRNGQFRTIRQLLAVKGIDRQMLYGEDMNLNGELDFNEDDGDETPPPDNEDGRLDQGLIAYLTCWSYDNNLDAAGSKRININNASKNAMVRSLQVPKPVAEWIVENRNNGFDSIGDLIDSHSPESPDDVSNNSPGIDLQSFSQIVDHITVSDEDNIPGMVNVNTAPREVLTAIIGPRDSGEQLADDIIAYRGTLLYGLQSVADLLNVESVDVKQFKELVDHITVRSNVYMVRCFTQATNGQDWGIRRVSEAIVDRSKSPCKVMYWHEGVNN